MYLKSFIESAIIIVIVKLLVEWGGGHMAERSKIVGWILKATSVKLMVICNDHRRLWRYAYKGVDCVLTLNESILHKIIIIIV